MASSVLPAWCINWKSLRRPLAGAKSAAWCWKAEASRGCTHACSLSGRAFKSFLRTFEGREPQIVDLGSSNGTFVNGQRLRANVAHGLKHGDVLRIGLAKWTFGFELPKNSTKADVKVEKAKERRASVEVKEAREPDTPGAPCAPSACAPPGGPCVPCQPCGPCGQVNVLPVPFPVMQAMPYAQPEKQETEVWKHELLQKLWQLEGNLSRLADANQACLRDITESLVKRLSPCVRRSARPCVTKSLQRLQRRRMILCRRSIHTKRSFAKPSMRLAQQLIGLHLRTQSLGHHRRVGHWLEVEICAVESPTAVADDIPVPQELHLDPEPRGPSDFPPCDGRPLSLGMPCIHWLDKSCAS